MFTINSLAFSQIYREAVDGTTFSRAFWDPVVGFADPWGVGPSSSKKNAQTNACRRKVGFSTCKKRINETHRDRRIALGMLGIVRGFSGGSNDKTLPTEPMVGLQVFQALQALQAESKEQVRRK